MKDKREVRKKREIKPLMNKPTKSSWEKKDKEKYGLDDKINLYDGHLIRVFSAEQKIAYQRWIITQEFELVPISFREIMKEAKVNLKEWGSVFIIIESLLDGVIYQFGNYDFKNVYKHGETRGYA